MADSRLPSAGFRRQLRDELARWRSDGLLSAEQSETLSARYRLADLAGESTGQLLSAIYIIGSILIAAGVVSLVAAHWDGIPKFLRVALLVLALLICHGLGVWQWKIAGTRPRLGHGLVILGTLIFGASIGLLAQTFQIHGDYSRGFGAWAIGAAVMAYAAGSSPIGFIAIVTSFVWFCGVGHAADLAWWYPLAVAAVLGPLVYRRRSVLLALSLLLAVGISTLATAVAHYTPADALFIASGAIAALYLGAGLWALGREDLRRVGAAALVLGVLALAVALYLLTFERIADHWYGSDFTWIRWYPCWILSGAALIAAVPLWVLVLRRWRDMVPPRPVVLGLAAGLVLLAAAISLGFSADALTLEGGAVTASSWASVIVAHVGLLAVAASLVAGGVVSTNRRYFWPGILMIAALVFARFFEYETGLLLKGAAFVACGVALIVAGIWFESRLRQRRIAHDDAR
jgi:uncharacterized membrane protein